MFAFFTRLIGSIVIISLLLLSLLIAFIPTIISSDWGRKHVVEWVNQSIPGKIELQNASLHWGAGQKIEGLVLKDPEGKTVLQMDRASTDASLWQLLRKNHALGFTEIQELNASIETNDKGETNLQRALGIRAKKTAAVIPPSTIVLSNVNLESYLFAPNHPFSVRIKGLTQQEDLNGSFNVDISLNETWASDWKKLKEIEKYLQNGTQIQAQVTNFPVDLLDRFAFLNNPSLNGLFNALLGDRLNLNLDQEPATEGLALKFKIQSPLFEGNLIGLIKRDLLSLKEPANFRLNLVPQKINSFVAEHLQLINPSRLDLTLSNLSMPLNDFYKEGKIDPYQCGLKVDSKLSETSLDVKSLGLLTVTNFQASLNTLPSDKDINLNVIGQAHYNQEPFDFHVTANTQKPRQFSEGFKVMLEEMYSTLTISHLPLQLIPFFQEHLEWKEELGSFVNMQLEAHPQKNDTWMGTLSLQTPKIVLKEAQFNIGKNVSLISPVQFSWTLSPETLKTLFKSEQLILDQSYPINFILKKFQLSLDNPQGAKIQLDSSIARLRFPKLLPLGISQFDDVNLKIEGQNLAQLHSDLNGKFALLNSEGTISPSPLIPEPLTFKQSSDWKIAKEGIEIPSLNLQIDNQITHLEASGQLKTNSIFELSKPLRFEYTLSPSALYALGQTLKKEYPKLQGPVDLKASIEPTEIDLKAISLSTLDLQGTIEAKKIALQLPSQEVPVIEDLNISWLIDSPNNHILAKIKGLAYDRNNDKPGHLAADAQLWLAPDWHNPSLVQSEMDIDLKAMPTSIATIFSGISDLTMIFGPHFDLKTKLFYDRAKVKPGYLDMAFDSENFHIFGRLKLDQQATIWDPKKPPVLRFVVSPESYIHLKKLFNIQGSRQLAKPFTVQGNISDLRIPLRQSWIDQTAFDLKIASSDIQWKNESGQPWKLNANAATKNLMDQIDFSTQISSQTSLNLQGSLHNLFDQNHRLRTWPDLGLQVKLNGQQLTPNFIANFSNIDEDQKQKIEALLGDVFDINLIFEMQKLQGFIQASAKGTQGLMNLDGQIKQGILTLNKPLEASIKMTPLFTQVFLAKNVPLLNTAIGSENPITFTIDPSQFSCPLVPFELEQVKIGKASLDLGKILFRNEGELSSILSLIRPLSDKLTIWFTPIYMELDRGILSLKRFDMLVANSYTLANWGTINLLNHEANFVLGLSAQTLDYAFGIQGLNENDILQIPLSSANGKVQIDKKKALARIGALVGQRQLGSKGGLLGSILDIAFSGKESLEGSGSYPPPTTQPFPWHKEFNPPPKVAKEPKAENSSDVELENNKSDKKKKKKKEKLLDESPLREVQEGAGQIFDKIFGH